MRRARPSSLIAFLLLLLLARAGVAAPDATEAERHMNEAARARAANLAAEKAAAARAEAARALAQRLAGDRVTAAQRLRQTELAAAASAARMQALESEQAETEQQLAARARTLEPLLPVLERLSLYPSATLLAVPAAPDDAVRGILVLQGIGHALEQQAATLRATEARLQAVRAAMSDEAPRLARAQAAEAAQSAELDREIAAAQDEGRASRDEAGRFAEAAASQAARQETLRGVIAAIEAQRRAALTRDRAETRHPGGGGRGGEGDGRRRIEALARPPGVGLSGAERLTAPVTGTEIRGFGAATDAGPASGITYRAPPGGMRVVSPCAGRAVFAAPFRSFGQLLILDCGDEYHVVLAGFGRLDAHAGQLVAAGEPVGVMPKEGGALYLELRRASQPINPTAWLRANG